MKYEKLEIETIYGKKKYIQIENGDGSFKSFPADPANSEYVAFLAQLEAEQETK